MAEYLTGGGPHYWRNEVGKLPDAVISFCCGSGPMSPGDISLVRAYFKHWISAPCWQGAGELAALRSSVDGLNSRESLNLWLGRAIHLGIDPL